MKNETQQAASPKKCIHCKSERELLTCQLMGAFFCIYCKTYHKILLKDYFESIVAYVMHGAKDFEQLRHLDEALITAKHVGGLNFIEDLTNMLVMYVKKNIERDLMPPFVNPNHSPIMYINE